MSRIRGLGSASWQGALALAVMLAAGGAARAVEILDGEEMRDLLFGNTLTGSHPSVGAVWNAYVSPDGAIHIRGSRSEGPYEYYGQVTIEDDLWCENWRIVGFEMKCRRIARDGDIFSVLRDDGKVLSKFVLKPGDPEGLGVGTPPAEPVDVSGGENSASAESTASSEAQTTETAEAAPEPPPEPAAAETAQADLTQGAPPPQSGAMTNDVVLRLHQIGQSDDSIVNLIQQSPTSFDLSPKAVETLRQAGVGTPVIQAMLSSKLSDGGTDSVTAPAGGDVQQPALPKSKSQMEGTDVQPPAAVPDAPPEETITADTDSGDAAPAAVDAAPAPEEPPAEMASSDQPDLTAADPNAETAIAAVMPDSAMPEGQGVYAMLADRPMELPATDVEVTIGLRMADTEKHSSAVDGFGASPAATLPRRPDSFVVNSGEIDARALRLAELGYMAERRADQFNLLGIAPTYFASIYGLEPQEKIPVGLWRPKTAIELLVEPIAGRPGMYRLTPSEPLADGRYALYLPGSVHPYDEVFLTEGRQGAQAYYFAVGNP